MQDTVLGAMEDTQKHNLCFFYCLLFNYFVYVCLVWTVGFLFVYLFKTHVSSTSFVSSAKEDSMMNRYLFFRCSQSSRKDSEAMFTKQCDKCCNRGVYKVLLREPRVGLGREASWGVIPELSSVQEEKVRRWAEKVTEGGVIRRGTGILGRRNSASQNEDQGKSTEWATVRISVRLKCRMCSGRTGNNAGKAGQVQEESCAQLRNLPFML